ncbi:sterol desaturase family protein [Acuticoccus sp.]|uniref:sterol desaturase family protein n=1 Tax=Acuticoccus sp. TaxID=1904378 RepID=UPI003B52ECA2
MREASATTTPDVRTVTPWSMLGMSGLAEIVGVSTALAVAYVAVAVLLAGAPGMVAAVVVAGVLYWTFLEYLLHRFVLHWEPERPALRLVRRCFPSHRSHHDAPLAERINIMLQLRITLGLTLAYTAALWACGLPLAVALALNAGILVGYQAYEVVHVACHHLPMRNAWAARLKRHHAIHHHRDETVNFGVTTTVWDHVFRTAWQPRTRAVSATAA